MSSTTSAVSAADVSVVIPTWNRGDRLIGAVESVLQQTSSPREVIVVDDGSTDDTLSRLARVEDVRLRVVETERAGVSAARNRGVAVASGRWIAFLDSDDLWQPTKLERQVAEARRSGLLLVHSDEIWIRRGVRVNPKLYHQKRGGRIFVHCLPRCCISPSAALLRRDLFESLGGFDESLPACEDYDLWLRLCARRDVAYVDEKLVIKHGGHDDQLSNQPALDRYRIRALVKLLEDDECHRLLLGEERRETLRLLREKLRVYCPGARKRGRHAEAAELEAMAEYWTQRT
ncbi:MAG: glycosyltransferase [Thermoanaerobaculia bacterium]|nr:glycosyltransferase [Thermoanaerobaculia bacterium]